MSEITDVFLEQLEKNILKEFEVRLETYEKSLDDKINAKIMLLQPEVEKAIRDPDNKITIHKSDMMRYLSKRTEDTNNLGKGGENMDLTKNKDAKKLVEENLKANKTDLSWQPTVDEMVDRASKGDIDFAKPTKEKQEALAKAYFKSQEAEPQAIDPNIIDKLFKKAKKSE